MNLICYPSQYQLQKTKTLLNLCFFIGNKGAGDVSTLGQLKIAASIIFKLNPRNACLAPTGYGKSEYVSMAVAIRVFIMGDKFVIASKTEGTADLIMAYVRDHLFDTQYMLSLLDFDGLGELERLKRKRTSSHLTGKSGGSLKIISLHGSENDVTKGIGEHVPNLILDESPLCSASTYLQVLKIMEGTGDYKKTFLFELGNAINRNHFMHNVKFNINFFKIDISLEQAILENRIDRQSLQDKKHLPLYSQFYECKFPEEDEYDTRGYKQYITSEMVQKAMDNYKEPIWVKPVVGVDIGRGGDDTTFVLSEGKAKKLIRKMKTPDLTVIVDICQQDQKLYNIATFFTDDVGVGGGVTDLLKLKQLKVQPIIAGSKAYDVGFYNKRTELYWNMKLYLENGGTLNPNPDWFQLTWTKHKETDKVIQAEAKEEIKKRHSGISPDVADAATFTCEKIRTPRLDFF